MKKHILMQYIDLEKEKEEVEDRIEKLRERLNRINAASDIQDIVKGGEGGTQRFHVNGFSNADYEETNYLLKKNIRILQQREQQIVECIVSVEQYLNTLDDSRMRRMITHKYVEGKTWNQVAHAMGKHYTADSCRIQMKRFLKDL